MSSPTHSFLFTRVRVAVLHVPLGVWLFLFVWLWHGILLNSGNLTEFNLQQIGVEAIVERSQFFIEGSRTPQLQPQGDVFAYNGHLYAAKQPGQFLFGAVVYFVLHALGLTYLHQFLLTSALVTWFTSGLVTAFAAVVVYKFASALSPRETSHKWAVAIALTFALATTAAAYAGIAHHDALASGFLIGAFYMMFSSTRVKRARASENRALLAGALLGLTLTTSVLPFFMTLVAALYFLSLRQWHTVPFFVGGGLLGIAPLLWYDAVNFGNPLLLPNFAGNFSDTFFYLDAENFFAKISFYATQLTLYVPLFWFGLAGWLWLPKTFRREQFAALGMLAALGAYILNINTTGGCQYGPRYVLPAMPFAALGLMGLSYVSLRPLRLALGIGALGAGIASFVLNSIGASYGAMFCNLQNYAVWEYLAAAQRGNFLTYPLAIFLLVPFLFCSIGLALALFAPPRVEQPTFDWATRAQTFLARFHFLVTPNALLLVILAFAFFLRVYRIWEIPPALWYDEAFYGIDAQRVLQGNFQIFFAQNGGREPLFVYLQALALAVWGNADWVLRVVPIGAGVATVALMYPLGRVFFGATTRGRAVGLVAAAALAVSFWHVSFSRMGLRVILLPFVSAIVMYFFWRGWQAGRRRNFVYSGIALGLAMYTYLAARALPLVLFFFSVLWFLITRTASQNNAALASRRVAANSILVFGVAFVVALPLLAQFALHPADFFGRAEYVALVADNNIETNASGARLANIAENARRVAGMFFLQGDMNPRHNLPGRPALDAVAAFGFLVGIVVGIVRARREPIYLLLFLWLAAMLAASVLSTEAPHFLRTLGALPPIMLLLAEGLTRVWHKFFPTRSFGWLALTVLAFGGITTFHDYFQIWSNLPAVSQQAFDTQGKFLAARVLRETERADVLFPLRLYGRSTIQFLLHNDLARVQSYTPQDAPMKPLVILTAQGAQDKQWVLVKRDARADGTVYFPDMIQNLAKLANAEPQTIEGYKRARVGQIIPLRNRARTQLRAPAPTQRVDANFGNLLKLVGADILPQRAMPEQTVEVALYWQPLSDLERDYQMSLQVMDGAGQVYGEWRAEPIFGFYNTGLWKRDVIVTDLYPLRVPADMPTGEYHIFVSVMDMAQERLQLVDARDNKLEIGTFTVTAP